MKPVAYQRESPISAVERLRAEGAELWLAVLRNSKLGERLGRERMFFNVRGAVERYEKRR
jgi:hypothetical protein